MRYCCLYIYDARTYETTTHYSSRAYQFQFWSSPIRPNLIALNKVDQGNKRRKKPIATYHIFTRPETFRLDFGPSS